MSNMFSKHFHLCFFKLKCPTSTSITTTTPPHPKQSSSSPSPSSSTTTFPFSDDFFSSSSDSDSWDPPPPDFISVYTSQRFFFSSPGLSNSIVESPDTRPTTTTTTNINHNHNGSDTASLLPRGGGVEVPKYSLNPYVDFRRSMQEMIESRELVDVKKDWDYLHDLLLCYLSLNPSHTHRYIVRAFTDLVVHILSSPPPPSSVPENIQEPSTQ